MKADLLSQTRMLDFSHDTIQLLIEQRQWRDLPEFERIGAVYDFVRNEIVFGYNKSDEQTASQVLSDGYGQCNTKGTLLMALFRSVGIPCRLHGFTIDKSLQRGIVPEIVYKIAPRNILHSWVEILHDGKWINLEGIILDDGVLGILQQEFEGRSSLCGYGAGTDCLDAPSVQWAGNDTYIQDTGINQDFGLFDTPDDFYHSHTQNFGIARKILYQFFIRHWMNVRVVKMRNGIVPVIPGGPEEAPELIEVRS